MQKHLVDFQDSKNLLLEMSFARSTLVLVLVSAFAHFALCSKVSFSQTPSNSWGTPTGTSCFTQNVRAYGTSQTLSITTTVGVRIVNTTYSTYESITQIRNFQTNINYIRCWSGSSLLPTAASLIAGGIGTMSATIQLSSRYKKLNGGCEALCV